MIPSVRVCSARSSTNRWTLASRPYLLSPVVPSSCAFTFPPSLNYSRVIPNGSVECFQKVVSPSPLELLSHDPRRVPRGSFARPHVRVKPDFLPELSWPSRRRLASSRLE